MTKEQAQIVLLEQALEQAIRTIEFIDGCLRYPESYRYDYPEHTQKHIVEFRKLVPTGPIGCFHASMDTPDCASCKSHRVKYLQKEKAIKVLDSQLTHTIKCIGCGLPIQGNQDLCSFCLDSDDFK